MVERHAQGESYRRGKPDKQPPLFKLMSDAVKSGEHLDATLHDRSLLFRTERPFGGHWVRTDGKRVLLATFDPSLHSPVFVIAEFSQ